MRGSPATHRLAVGTVVLRRPSALRGTTRWRASVTSSSWRTISSTTSRGRTRASATAAWSTSRRRALTVTLRRSPVTGWRTILTRRRALLLLVATVISSGVSTSIAIIVVAVLISVVVSVVVLLGLPVAVVIMSVIVAALVVVLAWGRAVVLVGVVGHVGRRDLRGGGAKAVVLSSVARERRERNGFGLGA